MTKRFFSLLLSMAILFTVTCPAFAADEDDGLREATFDLVDESVTIRYRLNEENRITYAEVGSDVIEVIGNEIYLNGELIATITTEIIDGNSGTIEPRTGWMYSDECTFGDPEDYTRELDPKFHNITFKKAIGELSMEVILSILVTTVQSFAKDPTGASLRPSILLSVAEDVYNWARDYPKRDKIYAMEYIYGHKNGMGYVHKNEFIYYSDRACTDEISRKTMFSGWS